MSALASMVVQSLESSLGPVVLRAKLRAGLELALTLGLGIAVFIAALIWGGG